jgi:hypothetical protein
MSRLLEPTKSRLLVGVTAVVLGVPFAAYALLLAGNAYSAWRMSKVLISLEAIRVGDPAATIFHTISGCSTEQSGAEYECQLVDLPLEFGFLQRLTWKLPYAWTWNDRLARMGLRGRYLAVHATLDQSRVRSLAVTLIVLGRYESLGNKWQLADTVPQQYQDESSPPENHRTYMAWFHITSMPSGEGFRLYATPNSTPEELRARHVNSSCLFSFGGCEGLCELLPYAAALLPERKRGWGGCSGVPPSRCELKHDDCRSTLPQ